MIQLGDIVRVKDETNSVLCQVIHVGPDEQGTLWYECMPLEIFSDITREFQEHQLEKIV